MLRKILGIFLLIGGGAVLAFWTINQSASGIETEIRSAVTQTLEPVKDSVTAQISGRDVTITGSMQDQAAKDEIVTSLAAISGLRSVTDNVSIVKLASPFRFVAERIGDREVFAGNTPGVDVFTDALGEAASELEVAAGQPDQNWADVAKLGIAAIRLLKDAKFELNDRALAVSGTATDFETEDAVRGIFANLPQGYSAIFDLKIEPTVPYVFNARKENGISVYQGYVPDEQIRKELTAVIGEGAVQLERKFGMPDENWPAAVTIAIDALALADSGSAQLSNKSLTLVAKTQDPQTEAAIRTALADLPTGYRPDLSFEVLPTKPFVFKGQKQNGKTDYSGLVSSEELRARMATVIGQAEADKLTLAAGQPDAVWAEIAAALAGSLERLTFGEAALVDKSLSLTGEAANPTIKSQIEAALQALPSGYTAALEIEVKPVSPYSFSAAFEGEALRFSGFVPSQEAKDQAIERLGTNANTLEIAAGAPDGNWLDVMGISVDALKAMGSGSVEITDQSVALRGTVMGPSDKDAITAALSNMPSGYQPDLEIETLDDGKPVLLAFVYDRNGVSTLTGKAPKDLTGDDLARVLGISNLTVDAAPSVLEGRDEIVDVFAKVSSILPEVETLNFVTAAAPERFEGTVVPGVNPETVADKIKDQFPGTDIALVSSPNEFAQGAIRTNPETGKQEIYQNFQWLPVPEPEFDATLASCQSKTDDILASRKLTFLVSSDDLDQPSLDLIDELSETFQKCTGNEQLSIEIGGHTDSQGPAAYNADLSLKRATAVGVALFRKGVPARAIIAKGYGEALPIASNTTAQGRSENRRITLKWLEN